MKTKEIISELVGEERPFNIISSVYDNKIQKWSLVIIGLCITIGIPTNILFPNEIVAGVVMVIALLMEIDLPQG